jgi:hypothetical protein
MAKLYDLVVSDPRNAVKYLNSSNGLYAGALSIANTGAYTREDLEKAYRKFASGLGDKEGKALELFDRYMPAGGKNILEEISKSTVGLASCAVVTAILVVLCVAIVASGTAGQMIDWFFRLLDRFLP